MIWVFFYSFGENLLMKYLSLIILLCYVTLGQSQESLCMDKAFFNEERLLTNLKNLSSDAFEGRRTGTKGAKKARKYIVNEFYKLNVESFGKSFEQKFYFAKGNKFYEGTNILGFIKGSKYPTKYIVISAHYDHEGIKRGQIYNGADDNASGVSALFSFAEYFKKYPPKYSVILAAFDAEELGLQGSKYFVKNSLSKGKKIVFNLNMDMISRSNRNELFLVGARENNKLKYSFLKHSNCCKDIKIVVGHDGYDKLDNWTYSSDHSNFYKRNIPFLYFGVEDHPDYHEPTDDFEKINPEFYKAAVWKIIKIFREIDCSKLY